MRDHNSGLIGDSAGGQDQEDDSWMISYLDVLTLIVVLLVLLLALSEVSTGGAPPISEEVTAPEYVGAQGAGESTTALVAAGEGAAVDGQGPATASADFSIAAQEEEYDERYDELSDRFNDLAMQGVDASFGREGMTLRIADNLLFASGQAELLTAGMMVIRTLTSVLADFDGEISVEGHTDSIPINTQRFPSNWELSSARAISVLRFLQDEGIDSGRLRAVGYAESKPLQSNDDAPGRAANRRVELILREP